MAAGRETPRQKMIGMMYLVLTALLALNITKEVVNAFVTINDKLDASATIINSKIEDDYLAFDMKKISILAKGGDLQRFTVWKTKADSLKIETKRLVSFLLSECNDMIKEVEGEDWIAANGRDPEGNILQLRSMSDIQLKDNYDVPTQLFIGSDPMNPNERGLMLRKKIHAYRDYVTGLMGTYTQKDKNWLFKAPMDVANLSEALKTANPEDSLKISQFYRALTIPDVLFDAGEEKELPWVSAIFNQVPLVAAVAMFTSLKVDIKNAESIASAFMLAKIEESIYKINKIEPMVSARSAYLNTGDSMRLNVLIAAYDTLEMNEIRWGMDADTLPERWRSTTKGIDLSGSTPGIHKLKGVIGIKERDNVVWKPWDFEYTVGAPVGVISQPKMRLLYRGFKNEIEATASGFPADKVSVSVSSGCRLERNGSGWTVWVVDASLRTATITVKGQKEDGSIVTVASNNFEIRPMPKPEIFLGGIVSGQNPSCSAVRSQTRISLRFDSSVPLTGVAFDIIEGTVQVDGITRTGKINSDGSLNADAKTILAQACGKKVTITCVYKDPSNVRMNAVPSIFYVR